MVLFISCYTDLYEEEAKGLVETLEKFNLKHNVARLESLGSWNLNTKLKTTWIKKNLQEQQEPVVWLDADARVEQYPQLFFDFKDVDFACHMRRGVELLSGALYFGNNEKTHEIVEQWIAVNARKPAVFDQRNLHEVVKTRQEKINWHLLPPTYCLFDLIVKYEGVKDSPVIWHRQASRRLRGLANMEGRKK